MNCIKIDLFYTDTFIHPIIELDQIRMTSLEEISAMKLDVIARNGRKKDFWDIHELQNHYSLIEMASFHENRYPFTHNMETIKSKLIDFSLADEDFDPICLRGKHWELIKLDMIDYASTL